MSEEIEDIKSWVDRLQKISLEGTVFLILGLILMLIGILNSSASFGNPMTNAGGYLIIGGVLFITLINLKRQ